MRAGLGRARASNEPINFYSRDRIQSRARSTHMVPHNHIPLVILIGLPGSGKSTIAHRWQMREPGRYIISTDDIRQELFGNAATQGPWPAIWREVCNRWERAIAAIRRGEQQAVLFDATHANRRDRRRTIETAQQLGFTTIDGYWLDIPLETCVGRNRQRSRQVPEFVIRRMNQQLQGQPPHVNEGFDHVYTVIPTAINDMWQTSRD